MAPHSSRTQAEQIYALTNELQGQLKVFGESHADVNVQVKQSAVSPSRASSDIEALAFIVMMQAAKSAQDDLKEIMEQVKAINRAKEAMREKMKPSRVQTALDF